MTTAVDVVVVGSVNRDYVCRVQALPRPGETVLGEATVGSGGKGGNQAVAASLLGARTALVARVGDDDDGRALLADLAAAWVDITDVVALAGVRTGMAFVTVDVHGENSIAVAPGANDRLEPRVAARAVRTRLAPTGVVVVQAEIPDAALAAAVESAVSVGCRAVVNLAPYRPLADELLGACDPLVVNESEAGSLLGRDVRGLDSARTAVSDLARRVRSVVVTVGAAGALVGTGGQLHHVPAAATAVTDTTGAGDAFTGALAAALSAGRNVVDAVGIGVRAGTHAVAHPGAQASFAALADLGLEPLHVRGH